MKIRPDFSEKAVVRPKEAEWVPSPQKGVDRLMLDRIGEEIARATTLVRFEPGSSFPFHEHGGGEEVFVVEGVFEDEFGRYPAGTYLRDPVGTAHAPFTKEGCTLFVKLWQFPQGDTSRIVIETRDGAWKAGGAEGVSLQPLHEFAGESTSLVRLAPGKHLPKETHPGGEEILVLEGTLSDEDGDYPAGSWLRQPPGSAHAPFSEKGCTLFVKTGHLVQPLRAGVDAF